MKEICAPALALIDRLGDMACFLAEGFRQTFRTRRLASKVMRQVYVIGANSMFVILLIGLFTGLVLGLQAFYAMSMFGAQGMLGSLLALTLIREMAPVLTAVMITARAGSAMTAEIGVMRISDQIDALEVMDIHPVGYLVTPRLLASLITFPLLTSIFTVIGIFGGYLSACVLLSLNEGRYFSGIESSVTMDDIQGCFLKAAVFAVIVILVCCYQGYNAHRRKDGKGAEAVGNATTSAVVMSCVLILVADYVLTSFLL
jgi:phospholipid/cholesterol/gamma-HCH transport system permease protein